MNTDTTHPIIPGVHLDEGRPYEPGSLLKWLQVFAPGAERVPDWHKLPVPVQFRAHNFDYAWPHALAAIEEAWGLEMEFHLSLPTDLTPEQEQKVRDVSLMPLIVSYGNGKTRGEGFRDLAAAPSLAGEVQDDAGIRSAVANAKALDWPRIAFHSYGSFGFHPGLLTPLRHWYPDTKFTITELHWGFRGQKTRAEKPELYTYGAGAYCAWVVEEAAKLNIPCCLFTLREFFNPDGTWTDSLIAVHNGQRLNPLRPSRIKAMRLLGGMVRNQYLPLPKP